MHTLAELVSGLKKGVVVLKDRQEDGSHQYVYVTLNRDIINHSYRQNTPEGLSEFEIEDAIRGIENELFTVTGRYEDKTNEWALYDIQAQRIFKVAPHYFRGVAALVGYTVVPEYCNYPDDIGYADENSLSLLVGAFQEHSRTWTSLQSEGIKLGLYQLTEPQKDGREGEVELTCLSVAETQAKDARLVATIVNLSGTVESVIIEDSMIEAMKAGNELEYKLKDESWIIISIEMREDSEIPTIERVIDEQKGLMVMDTQSGCVFMSDFQSVNDEIFKMPCYALKIQGTEGEHRTEFYLASA